MLNKSHKKEKHSIKESYEKKALSYGRLFHLTKLIITVDF